MRQIARLVSARAAQSRPGAFLSVALAALLAGAPLTAHAQEFFRVIQDVNVRAGPSTGDPIVGVLLAGAVVPVETCNANWCLVREGGLAGWASRRYLAAAGGAASGFGDADSVPAPGAASLGEAPAQPAPGGSRTVYPDGTLEILNAEGFGWRRLPNGNLEIVRPDGISPVIGLQAQSADPPPLPPEYQRWGELIGGQLSATLRNILTDEEMTAYLQTEDGRSGSALIRWRIDSIEFLTRPGF